jgi:hypothetical protein
MTWALETFGEPHGNPPTTLRNITGPDAVSSFQVWFPVLLKSWQRDLERHHDQLTSTSVDPRFGPDVFKILSSTIHTFGSCVERANKRASIIADHPMTQIAGLLRGTRDAVRNPDSSPLAGMWRTWFVRTLDAWSQEAYSLVGGAEESEEPFTVGVARGLMAYLVRVRGSRRGKIWRSGRGKRSSHVEELRNVYGKMMDMKRLGVE